MRTADFLQPAPGICVDFTGLEFAAVSLLSREEVMGSGHINTLDIRNIQNRQGSATGITILDFLLDSGFLPSGTGSCTATTACVIRFCRQSFHLLSDFGAITLLISLFLRKRPRAVAL